MRVFGSFSWPARQVLTDLVTAVIVRRPEVEAVGGLGAPNPRVLRAEQRYTGLQPVYPGPLPTAIPQMSVGFRWALGYRDYLNRRASARSI